MTPPSPAEKVKGLTYGSIHHDDAAEIKASWDLGNKFMAALILFLVGAMYLYFSFWLNLAATAAFIRFAKAPTRRCSGRRCNFSKSGGEQL